MTKEKPQSKTSDPYEIYKRLMAAARAEKTKKTKG